MATCFLFLYGLCSFDVHRKHMWDTWYMFMFLLRCKRCIYKFLNLSDKIWILNIYGCIIKVVRKLQDNITVIEDKFPEHVRDKSHRIPTNSMPTKIHFHYVWLYRYITPWYRTCITTRSSQIYHLTWNQLTYVLLISSFHLIQYTSQLTWWLY